MTIDIAHRTHGLGTIPARGGSIRNRGDTWCWMSGEKRRRWQIIDDRRRHHVGSCSTHRKQPRAHVRSLMRSTTTAQIQRRTCGGRCGACACAVLIQASAARNCGGGLTHPEDDYPHFIISHCRQVSFCEKARMRGAQRGSSDQDVHHPER